MNESAKIYARSMKTPTQNLCVHSARRTHESERASLTTERDRRCKILIRESVTESVQK